MVDLSMSMEVSLRHFIEQRWHHRADEAFPRVHSSCPLCGSAEIIPLFSKWQFEHAECQACDLVFVTQEPSQQFLDDLYENMAFYAERLRLVEKPRLERGESFDFTMDVDRWYRSLADKILPWQRDGLWLDVGGGTGRLLRFVKQYAPEFQTFLCESNKMAARLAEQYCGARTISWRELDDRTAAFSVISCIAVVEHVPETLSFFRRLTKLLKPGGVLYMTMPTIGPLGRRISQGTLYDVAPPMHLRFFSEKSMRCVERLMDGQISLIRTLQSHGRTFHAGMCFKPEWYELVDLPVVSDRPPQRVPIASPLTSLEKIMFWLFARLDAMAGPVTSVLDGQRVLHALWRKPDSGATH
jgi:SAM-dependent methyltransferase